MATIDDYLDYHYIHRSNWLRAAVLGANDGIISIASLAVGVVAAGAERETIMLATLAGLVAGALSMAAGEYVSVSSQKDLEEADIERERQELIDTPDSELEILTQIYIRRGLKEETALQVARELTVHDALGAHVRDELGINEVTQANPFQAAMASGLAFVIGGVLPLGVVILSPMGYMFWALYGCNLLFLLLLGIVSAVAGGSDVRAAVVRVMIWGMVAMGLTALVGYIFGIQV